MIEKAEVTLADFLLARIAEDDEEARERGEAFWYEGGWTIEHETRVLAECEAKRRIVDHAQWAIDVEGGGAEDVASFTLQHLAAVYADHPDYDPSWRA